LKTRRRRNATLKASEKTLVIASAACYWCTVACAGTASAALRMKGERTRVLLIEDEPDYARLVEGFLAGDEDGFAVETSGSLAAGLERLRGGGIHVALLDLGLPDSRGLKTLETVRSAHPDLPIIVISAVGDRTSVAEALERGAQDYFVKGHFVREMLARAVRHAIVRKRTEDDLNRSQLRYAQLCEGVPLCVFEADRSGRITFANPYAFRRFGFTPDDFAAGVNALDTVIEADRERAADNMRRVMGGEKLGFSDYTARRKDGGTFPVMIHSMPMRRDGRVVGLMGVIADVTEQRRAQTELAGALADLKQTLEGTVTALGATVELRDPYTAGHQRRVADMARAMSDGLGHTARDTEGVFVAALLHDLGKIAVPAEILTKPAPLTDTEYSLIKSHPSVGYDILAAVRFPWPVAAIVLQHHERMDGSGYPAGLCGDAIEPGARIIAVADTVEAMSSHRPYRAALGVDRALAHLRDKRGALFDSPAVDVCLDLFAKGALKLGT